VADILIHVWIKLVYGVITNDVSYYMNLLVRIAHIICNHSVYLKKKTSV